MKTIEGNWYAYPDLYDLAFQRDTRAEVRFLEGVWRRYGRPNTRTLLEPGCGTGRIVRQFAKRGYTVHALDRCPEAIEYLTRKLGRGARGQRQGRRRDRANVRAAVGDMTEFVLPEPVDGAYMLCNTFRHLLTEEAARRHLAAVARALAPGGIYVLGLHVFPPDADLFDCERWRETRGQTSVCCTFRVLEARPKQRTERLRTVLSVRSPRRRLRVRTDYDMRTYSAGQLRALVRSVPEFSIAAVFDFGYDLERPRKLDRQISDTVLILSRKPPLA